MKLVTGYLFLLPDTFGFPNEIFTFLLKKHLGKVEICFKSGFTLMPPVMPEPGGKQGAPQYLADQLTLKDEGGGLNQPIGCRYGMYSFNFHQNFSNYFW